MKKLSLTTEADCKSEIERMLKNSQTKLIMPAVAYGVLLHHLQTKETVFTDAEIKQAYQNALYALKKHLGHDVHFGAKYEDAYGMRMSRYGVLSTVGHLEYKLAKSFARHANNLCQWIPDRIERYIDSRVGIIYDEFRRDYSGSA